VNHKQITTSQKQRESYKIRKNHNKSGNAKTKQNKF
jgi:hypothetical protein